MAAIILGILCLLLGIASALMAIFTLWAGALEQSATGSGGTGYWPLLFAVISVVAFVGGYQLIF